MSKIQYKHLDLVGASLIQRRHKRQVIPPGMWAVTNFIPGRSDNVLSLRPDFKQVNANIFGISTGLQIQNFDDTKDFLNSVNGLYGSQDLIWFTSYVPWGLYATTGAEQILSSTMAVGRAVAEDDSYTVNFFQLGASYDIRQKWWRGCLIEFNGDGNYYVVDDLITANTTAQTGTILLTYPVQSDYTGAVDYQGGTYKWTASGSGTNEYYLELLAGGDPGLSEPFYLILDGSAATIGTVGSLTDHQWDWGDNDTLEYNTVYFRDDSGDPDGSGVTLVGWPGVTYTLYRTHNSMRAGSNRLAIDEFAAALIYCNPSIEDSFSPRDICGPFYTNVTESDWQYNVNAYTDLDIDIGATLSIGDENYTLATTGTSWIFITSGSYFLRTYNIKADDTWSVVDFDDVTFNVPQPNTDDTFVSAQFESIRRNSSLGYLVSGRVTLDSVLGGGETDYSAVFYSTDQGATWTVKIDTSYEDSSYGCEYDGTTLFLLSRDGEDHYFRYSTNGGSTWSDCTGVTDITEGASATPKVKLLGGTFVVISEEYIHYSTDGQAFSTKDVDPDISDILIYDIAYNNADGGTGYWVVVDDTSTIIGLSTSVSGTYTDVTPSWLASTTWYTPILRFVFYDPIGRRFIINCGTFLLASTDYGANWTQNRAGWIRVKLLSTGPTTTNMDWSGQLIATYFDSDTSDVNAQILKHILVDRTYTVSWDVTLFTPLSDLYRATTFSIIDGYTVLIGTTEWNNSTKEWDYYPKRIRWSVPGTYSNFSDSGSGSADAAGPGAFLSSVVVNGRIVVLETNRISSIVPRGDTDDPWDFDTIKDDFKYLSNPVAIDDVAYVIGSDGLLWQTDGINVEEVGASFDLTKFDDFDEDKPVWLVYSRGENAIYCYYRDTASNHPAYCISLANGGVTQIDLIEVDDTATKAEAPAAIVSTSGSTVQDFYVTHHPFNDDDDLVSVAALNTGGLIRGIDTLSPDVTGYWAADVESGELFITQEGDKASVKHLIVETYTGASEGDNSDRPYLVAEVKSIEDSDFATSGDTVGTATMTTSALTGSGTAWSTTIAGPAAGSTQQECDGAETDFTLPCLGSQARVYLDSTLQVAGTDYTVSGKTISFTAAPAATKTLYAYWENYPEVKVKVGDFFKSTEGWHRVTAISSAQDITLDHYLSTGSETVTHYSAWQLDDGHGRVEIGINRLVEGVQIRLYLIPDYDGTQQSTIAKITGLSIGYVPQGRKTVKATGS